jgi:hypothetical protein
MLMNIAVVLPSFVPWRGGVLGGMDYSGVAEHSVVVLRLQHAPRGAPTLPERI